MFLEEAVLVANTVIYSGHCCLFQKLSVAARLFLVLPPPRYASSSSSALKRVIVRFKDLRTSISEELLLFPLKIWKMRLNLSSLY